MASSCMYTAQGELECAAAGAVEGFALPTSAEMMQELQRQAATIPQARALQTFMEAPNCNVMGGALKLPVSLDGGRTFVNACVCPNDKPIVNPTTRQCSARNPTIAQQASLTSNIPGYPTFRRDASACNAAVRDAMTTHALHATNPNARNMTACWAGTCPGGGRPNANGMCSTSERQGRTSSVSMQPADRFYSIANIAPRQVQAVRQSIRAPGMI